MTKSAKAKIINGLEEALAHSIICNRLTGTLAQRSAAASEILTAMHDAGLKVSHVRPESDGTPPQTAGGNARAEKLSPERRSQIAKTAANSRWGEN